MTEEEEIKALEKKLEETTELHNTITGHLLFIEIYEECMYLLPGENRRIKYLKEVIKYYKSAIPPNLQLRLFD